MKLRLFGNETENLYSLAKTERFYQPFEPGAIVAHSGDLERSFGHVQSGKSADDEIDPLVLLETAEIDEERRLRPLVGIGCKPHRIDTIVDHTDRVAGNAARNQIVSRAHTNSLKGNAAIDAPDRSLRKPHRCSNGYGSFTKYGCSK